jgi:lyso-ornithine lipid O-acyltransferase
MIKGDMEKINLIDGIRAGIKVIFCAPVIIGYILTCSFWKLTVSDPVKQRMLYAKTVSWFCRRLLWYTNAELIIKNMPPLDQPFLLVGNHLGMMDILLLASRRPSLFITSVEMKNTPLLGTLCEMGGCLFVERRSRGNINNEINMIRETLKQGHTVVLYPEGTSTNGERILPFKKTMMTAAAGTGVAILPMVINYTHVNSEPMSWKWRDYVYWYGDQAFPPALWRMMSLRHFRVEIEFLNPIICDSDEKRREIASLAQKQIEDKFIKIPLGPGEVSKFSPPNHFKKTNPGSAPEMTQG